MYIQMHTHTLTYINIYIYVYCNYFIASIVEISTAHAAGQLSPRSSSWASAAPGFWTFSWMRSWRSRRGSERQRELSSWDGEVSWGYLSYMALLLLQLYNNYCTHTHLYIYIYNYRYIYIYIYPSFLHIDSKMHMK